MIVFVPAASAETLSEALWSLTRPAHLRGEADTQRLFATVEALNGTRWLEVDTLESVVIHAEAELGSIADILQPFIDAGNLPADTNTQLAALIEAKRGQRLVIYDAFPEFFRAQAKTRDEMITAGWLAAPVIP